MQPRTSATFFQNYPTPYRTPLFQSLSSEFQINVVYFSTRAEDRDWTTVFVDGQRNVFLPAWKCCKFTFNPTLPIYLFFSLRGEVILVSDALENIFSTVLIVTFAKISGKKVITISESFKKKYEWETSVRRLLLSLFQELFFLLKKYVWIFSDKILAYGSLVETTLLNYKVPQERILLSKQYHPLFKVDKLEHSNINIVFLGYLRKHKALDLLIRVFSKIDDKDIRLLIGGSGGSQTYFMDLAKHDKRVKFLGYQDEKGKHELFKIADIFILPSYHEPWGLVVNEALSCRIPIIVSSQVGSKDIVSHSGLIFQSGSSKSLRETLENLIRNKSLRENLSNGSDDDVKLISMRSVSQDLRSLIKGLK